MCMKNFLSLVCSLALFFALLPTTASAQIWIDEELAGGVTDDRLWIWGYENYASVDTAVLTPQVLPSNTRQLRYDQQCLGLH